MEEKGLEVSQRVSGTAPALAQGFPGVPLRDGGADLQQHPVLPTLVTDGLTHREHL